MIFMQKYAFLSKSVQNTEGYAKEGLYHFAWFLMFRNELFNCVFTIARRQIR